LIVISLLRWLRGTVTFIIKGSFPERLVSFCQKSGFPIWNIKRENDGISADTYASKYKNLRHKAKNCGVKIRITKKRGMFVWMHRYRKRKGIAAGVILAAVLIIFCSSRIWRIEVKGCSEELADFVKDELSANGVSFGCSKRSIDVKELQRVIMLEDDRVAWIAVNIVGSTAIIDVSEVKAPPQKLDPDDKIANIVASNDGQIKYLEVYDGQPLVKTGQTVSKGDIIVSGIMEDQYGKKQLKYARAKVIARVNEEIRIDVPLKQNVWKKTGKSQQRWYLDTGEKLLPLLPIKAPDGKTSVSEERKSVIFLDIVKRTYIPQTLETVSISEKDAKEYAMRKLDEQGTLSNGERVIFRTRKAQLLNGVYSVTEYRQIEKDIAETREVEWER